ncbi:MAG: SRPBCC family protein, partial [Pyrinomonadaceae bacterium]
PTTLLPGFLDEPVVIVKSESSIACLSNVCTHRGKILVEEPCAADLIKCRYHGRRFSLDGTFLSMPEFEGVNNFPCESDNLQYLAFTERAGFMFASIEPVDSFEAFAGDTEERLKDVETDGLRLSGTKSYEIDAHWALYCENYLEGFHIPFVHRSLNELIDYGTYTTELFRYSSLQTGFNEKGEVVARYLFIFPNLMFNYYPWGISVNVVNPITSSKTNVDFFTYTRDTSETGAGDDLHAVEMEDEAVVESVQQGIRSRFYTHGRYSPTREQGTHNFHRLIAEFMG